MTARIPLNDTFDSSVRWPWKGCNESRPLPMCNTPCTPKHSDSNVLRRQPPLHDLWQCASGRLTCASLVTNSGLGSFS